MDKRENIIKHWGLRDYCDVNKEEGVDIWDPDVFTHLTTSKKRGIRMVDTKQGYPLEKDATRLSALELYAKCLWCQFISWCNPEYEAVKLKDPLWFPSIRPKNQDLTKFDLTEPKRRYDEAHHI
jgi:hypothetical protein